MATGVPETSGTEREEKRGCLESERVLPGVAWGQLSRGNPPGARCVPVWQARERGGVAWCSVVQVRQQQGVGVGGGVGQEECGLVGGQGLDLAELLGDLGAAGAGAGEFP